LLAASISSPDRALDHCIFIAAAGSGNQPADCQGLTALGAHLNRHLVGCTTNAARTHFNRRRHVLQRLMEHRRAAPGAFSLDAIKRTVDDTLGDGLLAIEHQVVHELGQNAIAELRVRVDFAFFCAVTA
jgi:hypothetical protein